MLQYVMWHIIFVMKYIVQLMESLRKVISFVSYFQIRPGKDERSNQNIASCYNKLVWSKLFLSLKCNCTLCLFNPNIILLYRYLMSLYSCKRSNATELNTKLREIVPKIRSNVFLYAWYTWKYYTNWVLQFKNKNLTVADPFGYIISSFLLQKVR